MAEAVLRQHELYACGLDQPSFVIVDRDGARIMLKQVRKGAALPASNASVCGDGAGNVYVYVEDVRALGDEIRPKGAEILMEPTDRAIYNGREMQVRDPNGYVILFGQLLG